eukprot:m.171612 g.171612  ORF g.171612 m.171612 type:complete len:454 (-) comp17844_c0_seq4:675-2036(-)
MPSPCMIVLLILQGLRDEFKLVQKVGQCLGKLCQCKPLCQHNPVGILGLNGCHAMQAAAVEHHKLATSRFDKALVAACEIIAEEKATTLKVVVEKQNAADVPTGVSRRLPGAVKLGLHNAVIPMNRVAQLPAARPHSPPGHEMGVIKVECGQLALLPGELQHMISNFQHELHIITASRSIADQLKAVLRVQASNDLVVRVRCWVTIVPVTNTCRRLGQFNQPVARVLVNDIFKHNFVGRLRCRILAGLAALLAKLGSPRRVALAFTSGSPGVALWVKINASVVAAKSNRLAQWGVQHPAHPAALCTVRRHPHGVRRAFTSRRPFRAGVVSVFAGFLAGNDSSEQVPLFFVERRKEFFSHLADQLVGFCQRGLRPKHASNGLWCGRFIVLVGFGQASHREIEPPFHDGVVVSKPQKGFEHVLGSVVLLGCQKDVAGIGQSRSTHVENTSKGTAL